ncbi:MAG: phenylalanine--tRNA ligase subunit alpha [Candidatus Kapaibacteriales bacterium]
MQNLNEEIESLRVSLDSDVETINDEQSLEQFRLKYLVKKGLVTALLDTFKSLPPEGKKEFGKPVNELKRYAEGLYSGKKEALESAESEIPTIDLTLPGRKPKQGSRHIIPQIIDEMTEIFTSMGFTVAEGPEIEDGYHNFDALNFPPDHPARDMQDTFFVKDSIQGQNRELVLRTHTSPVQIRMMENKKPPIRSIMPGRVYRNEALDATHLAEFHQMEGLYINKGVSFAELKGTMLTFAKRMYGDKASYRFRPSFFPFTEPSAELDVSMDGGNKWMEVVGCGMVHPNVLSAGGIDPEVYSGYAFGFGIERIAMLRTGLEDIRLLYENDVRILEQF